MPKSYELKLREAEERRRPRQKEELYKVVEGKPQRMLIGFDHPETLQLEMQLTYCEDMLTIEQTHEHLLSQVRRLNLEYKRRPLRCNYDMKYIWFDRYVMRPRLKDRELVLQDFSIQPGYRLRLCAFYQGERMWGMPDPHDASKNRPADMMGASEDPNLLVKVGDGDANARNRLFCWLWMGGQSTAYIAMAKALPKDWVCYALELPNRGNRIDDEGYPSGEFAVEVMVKTLATVMRRPGNSYFFAHSQGTHFMYYATKRLSEEYDLQPRYAAVSNFAVPSTASSGSSKTLCERMNQCLPLRIFVGLIKGGWGLDPKLGFKSHTGWQQYQTAELWPAAKMIISDHWITKDFPLRRCDEPLKVPILALYGKEDAAVSREMLEEWKGLSSLPESFQVSVFSGNHMWFTTSSKRSEELANKLVEFAKTFL